MRTFCSDKKADDAKVNLYLFVTKPMIQFQNWFTLFNLLVLVTQERKRFDKSAKLQVKVI